MGGSLCPVFFQLQAEMHITLVDLVVLCRPANFVEGGLNILVRYVMILRYSNGFSLGNWTVSSDQFVIIVRSKTGTSD